jgi:arsenate reductase
VKSLKVLFLCTGNSARSILGEYLLRHRGGDRFETRSAGARPMGRVHPLALRVLAEDYGIDASGAKSESWEVYRDAGLDVVLTVCDHARDTCPVFPGPRSGAPGIRAHWGSEDPAAFEGPEEEALELFRRVARQIDHRVTRLAELDVEGMPPDELRARLAAIGNEDA